MPKVVTFSLFLGLSISSCAVWASAWLHMAFSLTLAAGASNATLASQRQP
jgi:hypothetical protein